MKKHLILLSSLLFVFSYCTLALAAINTGLPGINPEAKPPEFIGGIYNFALLISGVLALGAIVYGGVRYMTSAGNPSAQNDGKEWVKGAIFGLLLLFGAYLILNIVNPDITKLSLPALAPIPAGGGGGGIGLTQQQAFDQLTNAGIGIAGPIQLAGIRQSTVDEIIRLKNACNCDVTVTSATGGNHESGACSHANGYKVDLRSTGSGSALTNYITQNYQQLPDRSDGAKMYRAPTGALYALESDHWDVMVPPCY